MTKLTFEPKNGKIYVAYHNWEQNKAVLEGQAFVHIMPPGKRIQALPGNELLRDLPLELDAVGTSSGDEFWSLSMSRVK